ncbi:MAG: diaminopropionate ammonia-lyase, partial [Albidovulum sp.]
MTDLLPPARLKHVAATRSCGRAAQTVVTPEDFATAGAEITQWDGYAPTPLVLLGALARRIGVGEIAYKDEGPRFGLGSFKALGGSYAALRVLQREISARTGKDVSLA